jgi:hypothetical protein
MAAGDRATGAVAVKRAARIGLVLLAIAAAPFVAAWILATMSGDRR